jgi:hypothetical protein
VGQVVLSFASPRTAVSIPGPGPEPAVRAKLDWFVLAAGIAYCAAVVFVTLHHEFWEDEVRTWSIAREAGSLPELFASIRDDGHPALWYLVLFAGTRSSASPAVLPACSLLIAAAAVACFLVWSSFSRWLKLLFLCGVLPLYEYSVMARNYGLLMLTLFAVCALYPRRMERPLPLALALALLANTSAHGTIVAAGFVASALAEWLFSGERRGGPAGEARRAFAWSAAAALLVVAAGFAAACIVAWPDSASTIFHPERLTVPDTLHALGHFLRDPAHSFQRVLWGKGTPLLALAGAALVWLVALALLDKPYLLGAFLCGAAGLSLFLDLVYRGPQRHQGVLVLLIVAVAWLAPAARGVALWPPLAKSVAGLRRFALPAALAALLATHAVRALDAIRFDLGHDMTSAKAFGDLLRQRYGNAIVMGEPDSPLESLPFYASNPIYIPREHRFGDWTRFTADNQRELSLGELMRIGKALREQTRQPVLLALGHDLGGDPPIVFAYGSVFTWSRKDRALLRRETEPVASFQSAATERYEVFSFR